MESSARREEAPLTPREIFERLDRFVIGQDAAKRAVAIAAHNHLKRIQARRMRRQSLIKKSNILLIGPTGSGKTHIARNLADILNVPFTTVDATEYTEAGYYGKDVEVMVSDLLFKSNHSVEDTQRGIIFIDEVDKIARRTQGARNGAGSRDIGGEGVQQSLLKLLEGREVHVPMNVTQAWNKSDFVQVDTRDILFICAGTFSDLHDFGDDGGRAMGFGADATGAKRKEKRISTKQLVDFGMMAEFLGRMPVMVQLERLGEPELLRVLTEPPDAITREFKELLSLDDIELEFPEAGLREVVRYSVARGLGARGLRSILEHVMSDVMFEAPERRHRQVAVDAEFVKARLSSLDDVELNA
ncbi:ATP-dependent Clp protease ATP-binding subunit ClpX [Corallococcus praedator]|uniref:ATP-dependent Clp protease ATP-binding subunit ClpX n=1 Tax=Corallococcus praedator TaxID=2316724 RepID=A0ABX9QR78_9BACT|nr:MULTISPECIES: ATP-dependent Clp protease ATP-binding subunit ClpX [Corallococcus]RKH19524.1 ATP-dependent Clp protease ATP-binding subunit ClpX [Corallococcus sp. CA047B]RKH33799.1 ATP-dependent Clp protease ATP-binding subunit ClpX [Corallococcus sp. CA031C]RKI15120.1 ATP-dependent Clp protease ATP-binding subunit ClpX [Corallococcus praedator]